MEKFLIGEICACALALAAFCFWFAEGPEESICSAFIAMAYAAMMFLCVFRITCDES